jgi:hypothetical protein
MFPAHEFDDRSFSTSDKIIDSVLPIAPLSHATTCERLSDCPRRHFVQHFGYVKLLCSWQWRRQLRPSDTLHFLPHAPLGA